MFAYLFYILVVLLSLFFPNIVYTQNFFDHFTTNSNTPQLCIDEIIPDSIAFEEKECTFAVYIAARNNLARFVARNVLQMMHVGTNEHLTIVVHLDSMVDDHTMLTQRFIIYQHKIVQVGETTAMDSGDPNTLIDFCRWAFTNFPCKHPMLTLWSHGIGDLEISEWFRTLNVSPLYVYNPQTHLIEINRSTSFLEYTTTVTQENNVARGICFDDITGHCLTNHDVGTSLAFVRDTYLKGEPFACLLCDACLMNSIGFIFSLKPYTKKPIAHVLIGSQEAVLATGYDYYSMLKPLSAGTVSRTDFAQHVINTFSETYAPIVRDYTQSAIALACLDPLYEAIDHIAHLLMEGLMHQKEQSVENFIDYCSNRNNCTYFAEPSYKDMHHLFTNMRTHRATIVLHDPAHTQTLQNALTQHLENACTLIRNIVISNQTSTSLNEACGISIYLPKKRSRIHHSYQNTDFGKQSAWYTLLTLYLTC